jgi:outer membrane protein TolC
MGLPIQNKLTLNGSIENIKLDDMVAKSDTSAYANRIEYNLLQTQLKLNQLDLKRYKFQYLPSLAAFGSSSLQYQSNSFRDLYSNSFPTTIVGLQLNIPIFSSGMKLQRVKQAEFQVQKSQNILADTKNAINLDVFSSLTAYTNSLNTLKNQQSNLDLANEVLRVSKIKYEQGVGSSLEVTQAQTALKEAENNYINTLYEALISKVDTQKALGLIQ